MKIIDISAALHRAADRPRREATPVGSGSGMIIAFPMLRTHKGSARALVQYKGDTVSLRDSEGWQDWPPNGLRWF